MYVSFLMQSQERIVQQQTGEREKLYADFVADLQQLGGKRKSFSKQKISGKMSDCV